MAKDALAQYYSAQLQQLKKHLAYCQRSVPYFRQYFQQHGLQLEDFRSAADLKRLPLLSKQALRAHLSDFIGDNYDLNKLHSSYSSGSTGEPFASYFNPLAWYRKKYFLKLRARFACGMGFFQRVAILECESVEQVEKRNSKAWVMDPLLKIRVFSLFQDHAELLQQLADFAPQNIYAYPSHLVELGQCMQKNDLYLPSVERLFTSSEFLEQGARRFICERFTADLFDHYGCTELKEVAWECPHHGDYHLNADDVMLEIVDGERLCELGEAGEVVLTDLRNKGMAFVRYKINDYGVKTAGTCECGFVGESFRPLGGRVSDNLQLPDGSELSPYSLTTAVEHTPGLIQYQLEQSKPSELLIHALWREAPAEEVIAELTETIASIVGADVDVQLRSVEQLDVEENGKFKVVKRSF